MRYIVFDCETTGLSPLSGDRICEIGALKIENYDIVDKYWSLINPEREISYSAYLVNKITPEMLKDAPTMDAVIPSFLEFIDDCKLAAYNAGFDISFLNAELARYDYSPISNKDVIDIYILARKILPHLGYYPLWNVARELKVSAVADHRALSDAQVAAEVLIRLLKMGGEMILSSGYLDYSQTVSALEKAIKKKEAVKVRFLTEEGDKFEKVILPCGIKQFSGEEFLEYKSGNDIFSIPVGMIEEVL